MNSSTAAMPAVGGGHRVTWHAGSVGLWAFMGVASALFALFLAAYVMRMQSSDWVAIATPWQLWLSTSILVAASVLMQRATSAAQEACAEQAQKLLLAGGLCALAFICAQLWAWQSLQAARVGLTGNPAASFFYLLTSMHGLHVIGGLVAWGVTLRHARRHVDMARSARAMALCARYWHFLLAVWAVLFTVLGWLTPEIVAFICGTEVAK